MRPVVALLLLAALAAPRPAAGAEKYLAVGDFTEAGPNTRGDGRMLAAALEFELTNVGLFEALPDRKAEKARRRLIKNQNVHRTDENYWIELGHEAGASHLLTGSVSETSDGCYAHAKLTTLKTRKTKTSLPERYDCTTEDLKAAAGNISYQLIRRRYSSKRINRPKRKVENEPFKIQMSGPVATIDGRRGTFKDGKFVPLEDAPPLPTAPGTTDAGTKPATEPPPLVAPVVFPPPPEPPPATPPLIDATKYPGFTPNPEIYSAYDLAIDVDRRGPLAAGIVLLIPIVFIFIGAIAVRISRDAGAHVVQFGLSVSILIVCLALSGIGFYWYGIGHSIVEDADIFLVTAPFLAMIVWLIGGRMVVTYSEMRIWRRIFTVILYSAWFSVVLLIASQIHLPVIGIAIATVIFWAVMRFANSARKRRKERLEGHPSLT